MASKKKKYPKVTKKLKLDLTGIPHSKKSAIKKRVGNFIVNEILASVNKAKTPVEGGEYKKDLSTDYAKLKGSSKADMELEGDMLDALISQNRKGDSIEIGIYKKSETGKADGHNNHSKKSTLPPRHFIPDKKHSFKKRIMSGVNNILDEVRVLPITKKPKLKAQTRQTATASTTIKKSKKVDLNIDDVLADSFIDDILGF